MSRGLENLVGALYLVAIALSVSIIAFELLTSISLEAGKTSGEVHLSDARLILLGVGGGVTGGASYVLQATISNTGDAKMVDVCILGPDISFSTSPSSPVPVSERTLTCRSITVKPGTYTYSFVVEVDSQYLSYCPRSIQTCPVDEGWVVAILVNGAVKETIVPEYEIP